MPEHYYTKTPTSGHDARAFSFAHAGRQLIFETDAGVFSKGHVDPGTAMLLKALPEAFAGRALDLGCGWGAIGAAMAAAWPGADVVLTDVNERAAALARQNLARNGLTAQVVTGDGFSAVKGTFDLIATNPPIRAGKAVIYPLFEQSAERLNKGGALLLVIRKQQGADSAVKFLSGVFSAVEILSRGSGGYRVIRARL